MTMAEPRTGTTTAHLVAVHPRPQCYRPSNSLITWPQARVSVKRHIWDQFRHHCPGHPYWHVRSVARKQPALNAAHARVAHRDRTAPRHPALPTSTDGWRKTPDTARIRLVTNPTTRCLPAQATNQAQRPRAGGHQTRPMTGWKSRPPSAPAFQQPRQRRHHVGR